MMWKMEVLHRDFCFSYIYKCGKVKGILIMDSGGKRRVTFYGDIFYMLTSRTQQRKPYKLIQ